MTMHPDDPKPPASPPVDRAVELIISLILRLGVSVSLIVVIAGLLMSFFHHHEYLYSRPGLQRLTTPGRAFPRTLGQVLAGVRQLRGEAMIMAGLMLLIATPVLRVAVSIAAFIYEKDKTFVLLTAIVLALLILSFFLGTGAA
jgi:uncharacterized membrane protein